jgi:hypothetical protein
MKEMAQEKNTKDSPMHEREEKISRHGESSPTMQEKESFKGTKCSSPHRR